MPARSVLMVSPNGFAPDAETAGDNPFQHSIDGLALGDIRASAKEDSGHLAKALEEAGVEVHVFAGDPALPDDVFPNNWFSTHEDGTLVLYPMSTSSRRRERRPEIVEWLSARYPTVLDLSYLEERDQFLEGTGSLVLDRENRIAYAAKSRRTDEALVRNWCGDMEHEPVIFETSGPAGMPVYHTNVVMAVGSRFAVVCTECISNPRPVISALLGSGKELVEITSTQMSAFCGNILELQSPTGPLLAMSTTAHSAFTTAQKEKLQGFGEVIAAEIPTIERYGGGGLRCMLAELF